MHQFARFIQILGKGRNGMRSLTEAEAYEAMQMIACYDVEPEQLGAFLMLMRHKEETAQEVAGFARALRDSIPYLDSSFKPAIDWAAYAGKKRQLPWFVLAALILAQHGYPVLMHGLSRNDERVYVPEALEALDIEIARNLYDAKEQLACSGFSYISIENVSSLTADLINMRDLFGLRSPVHTIARMLNPMKAGLSLTGVFHPNFAEIHQQAAAIMHQRNAIVMKGEGGEFERIPDRDVTLYGVADHSLYQKHDAVIEKPGIHVKPERLNLYHFRSVWDGEAEDSYGELAVTATLAIIIKALGIEKSDEKSQALAMQWWQHRNSDGEMQEAI